MTLLYPTVALKMMLGRGRNLSGDGGEIEEVKYRK